MHKIRSETLGRRLASAKILAKSLAESLTKSLAETLSETLGETFGETLDETFRAHQASPQSPGSDFMHGSLQDSLRDSFFLRGVEAPYKTSFRWQWVISANLGVHRRSSDIRILYAVGCGTPLDLTLSKYAMAISTREWLFISTKCTFIFNSIQV